MEEDWGTEPGDPEAEREERRWLRRMEAAARDRERAEQEERIDHLPFLLRQASRVVDDVLRRLLDRSDAGKLSLTGVHVLVLCTHPMPVVTLADRLRISPQAMSRAVAALEAEGLVEKLQDGMDARVRLVRRTSEGEELLAQLRSRFVRAVSVVSDSLPEPRLAELADQLVELAMVDLDVPRWVVHRH